MRVMAVGITRLFNKPRRTTWGWNQAAKHRRLFLKAGHFSEQVAMEHMGGLICGGCLVSASAVLTAAHCTTAVGCVSFLRI